MTGEVAKPVEPAGPTVAGDQSAADALGLDAAALGEGPGEDAENPFERYDSYLDSQDDSAVPKKSLVARVVDAYADMRASTRGLIELGPSEGRLLMFALLSDVVFLAARSVMWVIAPAEEVARALPAQIGLGLVVAFLIRTSIFYATAAIATVIGRVFGGKGGWHQLRVGVFWAALVSAPVEVMGAVLTVLVVWARPHAPFLQDDWFGQTPEFLGPIAFGFFFAAGVAEAHRFRFTYQVLAVTALIFIGVVWGFLELEAALT